MSSADRGYMLVMHGCCSHIITCLLITLDQKACSVQLDGIPNIYPHQVGATFHLSRLLWDCRAVAPHKYGRIPSMISSKKILDGIMRLMVCQTRRLVFTLSVPF
jgi:hypothetical protein